MHHSRIRPSAAAALAVAAILACAAAPGLRAQAAPPASLASLLPAAAEWKASEPARPYDPTSLFEYIDGAAEAYIGYDFKALLVANFQHASSKATLTVEIYDMGSALNAFGIYGAERYPESRFVPIGVQGYYEEGTLNFLAGRYYVKLLGFEAGDRAEALLKAYAAGVAARIGAPGAFPPVLGAFAGDGLVANSEKYIARSFMGFKFLNRGYAATYKIGGQDYEAFVVEARTPDEAGSLLKQLAERFAVGAPGPAGFRAKDAYLKNVFVSATGRFLCGVTKIKDGGESVGVKALAGLIKAASGF
jgi:hypothetical protein